MAKNDTSYKFHFHKPHRSWRKGKAPPTVSYQACIQVPNLCIAKTQLNISHRRLEVDIHVLKLKINAMKAENMHLKHNHKLLEDKLCNFKNDGEKSNRKALYCTGLNSYEILNVLYQFFKPYMTAFLLLNKSYYA